MAEAPLPFVTRLWFAWVCFFRVLFDGAFTRAESGPECSEARRELLWAAALHEIGTMVSHHDHHRHSAYMLAHADAAGFSQSPLEKTLALPGKRAL